MSGSTEELHAVLTAAEACLRAAMAEALSPAAVLRVERESTRAARRLLADAAVARDVDLPTGWAEFVEIDDAIDALLARLPPVQVVARPVARVRPAPLPVVVEVAEEAPVTPAAPPVETAWVSGLVEAEPAPVPVDDDLPEWAAGTPTEVAAEAEPEPAYLVDPYAPADEAPAPAAADDAQWVSYEDQPAYIDDDEDGYYDEGEPLPAPEPDVQYIVYTESQIDAAAPKDVVDEPLPTWAAVERPIEDDEPTNTRPARPLTRRKEPELPPAPASLPATPEEPGQQEWAFASKPDVPVEIEGGADAYAVLRKERMRLDDFSQVESPGAEEVRIPRDARSGPAAIQISADGSGRVLGDDDDENGNVIELGDTRDYGDDDAIDEDQTGILGVGVVEYDDIDEVEEIDEVDNGLEDLPGAPELTPAEISALFARADEVGRRNMSEGTLLFGDVLDADPHRIDALLARGRLQLDLGDFPAAASDFLKAEQLQPRDPDVQVALGDLFQGRKDYGKAVSYYNRALAIDADNAPALARRGMAHYYRRQFNAAVEDLERAKKLDPTLAHVDTYLSRAKKK